MILLFRLEDPDSEETREFVNKQVELTQSVLEVCDTRKKLNEKITKLFDHPRYDPPFRRADKFFYFHNTGLQAQDVLYVQVSIYVQIWIDKYFKGLIMVVLCLILLFFA